MKTEQLFIRTTAAREEAVLRNRLAREQFTDDIRSNIHRFTTKPEEDEKRAARLAKSGEVFAEYERLNNADFDLIAAECDRLDVRAIAAKIAERIVNSGTGDSNAKVVSDSLEIARGIVEATKAPAAPAPEGTASNA